MKTKRLNPQHPQFVPRAILAYEAEQKRRRQIKKLGTTICILAILVAFAKAFHSVVSAAQEERARQAQESQFR